MSKPPAFQFYAADYLADENVQVMTLEEEGIYIRLLCYCWREGSIPGAMAQLMALSKGANSTAIENVIKNFEFSEKNQRFFHKKLDKQRKDLAEFHKNRSEAGKLGAKNRWRQSYGTANGKAMAQPMAQPMAKNGSSSSSSSTTSSLRSEVDKKRARGALSVAKKHESFIAAGKTLAKDCEFVYLSERDRELVVKYWRARSLTNQDIAEGLQALDSNYRNNQALWRKQVDHRGAMNGWVCEKILNKRTTESRHAKATNNGHKTFISSRDEFLREAYRQAVAEEEGHADNEPIDVTPN